MATAAETMTQKRFEDHEAFVRYERDRFDMDEKTRCSEQINGVMHNPFEYTYGKDGDLYYQGEALGPLFDRGIERAETVVAKYPQFMVELRRRWAEKRQYEVQKNIGRQTDDDPYILLHISLMPDEVNQGIELGAYDVVRQKVMIRVTEPIVGGVRTTSASLDGGNRLGVQAMADMAGEDIPDDATPEDILDMHFLIPRSHFKGREPVTVFRERYDQAMTLQFGGVWYAGRTDSGVLNTLSLVELHPRHTREYLNLVWDLKQIYGDNYHETDDYKNANYNYIKLMERLAREPQYDGGAVSAGDDARSRGETVSEPDCPTGNNLATQTAAEQALKAQGIGSFGKKEYLDTCMKCPHCKTTGVMVNYIDQKVYYTCHSGCKRTTLPDNLRPKPVQLAIKQGDKTTDNKSEGNAATSFTEIQKQFGTQAIVVSRLAIGGKDTLVVNKYTNEVYAKL